MEVPELIDEFVGDWRLVELEDGGKAAELKLARFSFLEDETGEIRFGGIDGWMRCRFGETLDGVPMVRFTWEGQSDSKPAKGSGFALLRFEDDELQGEVKVTRRASRWFVARRKRPRKREDYLA